jgi:hypothetical protein
MSFVVVRMRENDKEEEEKKEKKEEEEEEDIVSSMLTERAFQARQKLIDEFNDDLNR